jgi:hypothetical protein
MTSSTLTPGVDKQEWAQAAGKANEVVANVGEMARHATSAVGAMATQAACEVGRKADELTANAGARIEGLGERLGKNSPQAGFLGSASQSVAGAVKESGEYLQNSKLSGVSEDIAQLIKRHPVSSVLIGIGIGWYLGHKLRT